MTSPFAPVDRNALKIAVDEWIADSATAIGTYGDISTWDVGAVTDFSEILKTQMHLMAISVIGM